MRKGHGKPPWLKNNPSVQNLSPDVIAIQIQPFPLGSLVKRVHVGPPALSET